MHSFSYIATAAEEKKIYKILSILPWTSQVPFSLWKIENSPSGIQGKLISCTEYRVITKKKKRAANFHLSVNLHECSIEFELRKVSAGWLFYLVAHKGGGLASAAL